MQIIPSKIKEKFKTPKLQHYEAIRRGILACDAVIIEISNQDFQLGHEATLAIQAKKHVFCMSVHEDFSKKIRNEYFHAARYNEYNVGEVIRNFLHRIDKERYSERFNCFFSKGQLEYLNKTAPKNGMNKSEYLRKLIEDDRKMFKV